MTYEEFKEKYKINDNECTTIAFATADELEKDFQLANLKKIGKVIIEDDPKDYIEVAQKAHELESIKVVINRDIEFYKNLTEFIKECNNNVKIYHNVKGIANKEEFLIAEEKILVLKRDF